MAMTWHLHNNHTTTDTNSQVHTEGMSPSDTKRKHIEYKKRPFTHGLFTQLVPKIPKISRPLPHGNFTRHTNSPKRPGGGDDSSDQIQPL